MKPSHLAHVAFVALAVTMSCAQEDLAPDGGGVGGSAPAAGTGGTTGGAGGTGGATSAGGMPAAAGMPMTTTGGAGGGAGTVAAGAAGGTGGGAGVGGSVGGAGGMVSGAGGAPPLGGQGSGAEGGMAPIGGMPSSGGMAPATGGMGTAGTGSGALDPEVIVPDLNGFLWEITPVGTRDAGGKNYPLDDNGNSCPSGTSWDTRGTIRNLSQKVHGTAGQQYTIEFEVRGVAGTRCYSGGTPASTAAPNASGPNNTWYVGGKQANDSIWNTYEIHVETPAVTGEANAYFLNAFPSSPDWCQKEATYEIKYTASFKVMGDSTIRFTIHDSNCQAQGNCGPDEGAQTCTAPRTVDLSGMTPPPPSTFTQPPSTVIGAKNYKQQWLYFVVKGITSP
jgi:hypothetical protein